MYAIKNKYNLTNSSSSDIESFWTSYNDNWIAVRFFQATSE